MRSVVLILFFAIVFAPQSVSLKFDSDEAQVNAVGTHKGVILTDSSDCDDDYRNCHAASLFVMADTTQAFMPLVSLLDSGHTRQFHDAKLPLYQLHAVLRI